MVLLYAEQKRSNARTFTFRLHVYDEIEIMEIKHSYLTQLFLFWIMYGTDRLKLS